LGQRCLQPSESLSDGEGSAEIHGGKKHRRRPSKNKRRWRPYKELTWEEKKARDERAKLRASRIRAELAAKGLPLAPYNTNEFLMEEHDQKEPDLKAGLFPKKSISKSRDTTEEEEEEEEDDDDDDDSDKLVVDEGNFSETYERYHAESLQEMSKHNLIQEYLELEKSLSKMEDENKKLRQRLEERKRGGSSNENSKIRELELQLELEKMKNENLKLMRE
uniref:HEXIM P-TEFb complex subunit 1 n=1 Tax=Latimeria chalumnae TaxID=7897 RepID=H3A396_LATCH